MRNKTTRFITAAAIVAALYTVLSVLTNFIPTIGGVFQFRIAEAMCILPMFTPAAIPGLTLGCLLTNLINGGTVYDIVFGTLATALGAVLSLLLAYRKNDIVGGRFLLRAVLAAIPPVVSNALIIPYVIIKSSGLPMDLATYAPFILSVGLEELVCAGLLGVALAFILRPHIKKMLAKE
ncbi:MAG: QueT transporter family protein [Clostridia bacterium]|nr:QueT transporter family protein [Clostridia bacterium]